MADRLIDNATPGSATSPYDTWAKAATTAAQVDAVDAAADRWLFNSAHAESTAASVSIGVAGTPASPSQWVSVTPSGASGATGPTAGAGISTSGNGSLTVNGSLYAFGVSLSAGSGSSSSNLNIALGDTNVQVWESSQFSLASSNSANRMFFGSSTANTNSAVTLRDPTLFFASASQCIQVRHALVRIIGGALGSLSSLITVFVQSTDAGRVIVTGFDLSRAATAMNLVASGQGSGEFIFRYCKMPSGWSGELFAGDPSNPGVRAEMHSCDSGGVVYQTRARDYAGKHVMETTIVRSGGATDGTTPVSWKVTTTANAEFPAIPFMLIEMVEWNDSTGSSVTAEVEFVHDSLTALTNAEIWMEVIYLGTAGSTLSSVSTCRVADVLATAASQTSSAVTWTTTGLTNPNKQKLSVSFTPQQKGPVIARVFVAKASYTVYVDPKLTLSSVSSSPRQYQLPGGQNINETASGGSSSVALPPVRIAA